MKNIPFYKILGENGWHREDDQMYPPYGSFVISDNEDLPINVIEQQNTNSKKLFHRLLKTSGKENLGRVMDDLQNYIGVMEEIISSNSTGAK